MNLHLSSTSTVLSPLIPTKSDKKNISRNLVTNDQVSVDRRHTYLMAEISTGLCVFVSKIIYIDMASKRT
jgi:hypothetical protein